MNILITGCCGVVARAIARSIKLSEHYFDARIIGADVCNYWYGLHESLFDRIYRVSDISSAPEYRTQVLDICASELIDLAIVTPEKEVLFWMLNEPGIPITLPPPGLAIIASNKGKLYDDDRLLKNCSYERLEYFMGPVSPSGVTGNISRGRLVNEKQVLINAEAAIREIARQTREKIRGLFTVDLREDKDGFPLVTEINIRHTAATSAYAAGGCNMVEAQIHHGLNRLDLIDGSPVLFPENNYILRDIDGLPVWVHGLTLPEPGGEFIPEEILPC